MRAFGFLVGHVRAVWHLLRNHIVVERTVNGRVRSIYCEDCQVFLWVMR